MALKYFAAALLVASAGLGVSAPASADNARLNNSTFINIYTMQRQAGCMTDPKIDGRLVDAARRHALDAVNNPDINADLGTDGSTAQSRANDAGFVGTVAQTVATNPTLAINGIDILAQWYWDPVAKGIIENCANTAIGVWSENTLSRSVVVAVYGQPA
jgi:uncharacterized protein YkwD